MKQHLIFLISILCLLSHNTKAMDDTNNLIKLWPELVCPKPNIMRRPPHNTQAMEQQWPTYFTGLVCPEDKEIEKKTLLDSNHFWKVVAQSKMVSQTTKNKLLLEAFNLGGFPWNTKRKPLACTLAAGADPNAIMEPALGNYILHTAALMNDYHLIKLALTCGADPNRKNKDNQTSLFWARKLPIAQLLIAYNANISLRCIPPLPFAQQLNAYNGHTSLHERLGTTILHHVIKNKNFENELIPYYIQLGCDVNAQDDLGFTPIMHLASLVLCRDKIYETAFRLLLEAGADTTLRNNRGQTVWDMAKGKQLKTMQTIYEQYQQCKPCYALMNSLRLFSKID